MQNQMPVLGKDGSALRTAKLAGLMALPIIVLLALFGATPAHATTEPEWYVGGSPLSTTKWSPSLPIGWNGTIEMTYKSGERLTTKCEDTVKGTKGTIIVKGAGEITSWTMTKCSNVSNCEGGSIEAKNLPWHTQLTVSEGKVYNTVTEVGKDGRPYFKLTCAPYVKVECPVPSELMINPGESLEALDAKIEEKNLEHCSEGPEHSVEIDESKQLLEPWPENHEIGGLSVRS